MAADRGSIVHKALEILARAKLADQNGQNSFSDPELAMSIGSGVSDEEALDLAWQYYTDGPSSHHNWKHRDHDECLRLFNIALTHTNGAFNPRNRTIVQPEQYFDFEIEEDWAKYRYEMPDGKIIEGNLALKGAVDLIVEGIGNSLEYIDWKTGRRVDWSTGKPKSLDDLYQDFQLRLYHLALCKLYPNRDVTMTIFYLKDGGPFTMCFERSDLPDTIDRIRRWYEQIRLTEVPKRKIGLPCNTFCKFGTTPWAKQNFIEPGTDPHGNHLSICDHVHQEVTQLGVDRVFAKYGHADKISNYGAGGGSQDRDKKDES